MKLMCVIGVFLVFQVTYAQKPSLDCDAQLIKSDKAIDEILFIFNRNVTGYKSKQQMDDLYCKPFPEWLKEARVYRGCLKSFPGQVYSIVMNSIKKTWKTFCLTEENKSLAFRHTKCMKPTNRHKFDQLRDMIISLLEYIAGVEDVNLIIPGLCCGAKRGLAKFAEDLEKVCNAERMKGSGHWVTQEVIYRILQDALDMMCGAYDTLEICNAKFPDLMLNIENSLNTTETYNHTLVVPVVKLIQRLDGDLNLE